MLLSDVGRAFGETQQLIFWESGVGTQKVSLSSMGGRGRGDIQNVIISLEGFGGGWIRNTFFRVFLQRVQWRTGDVSGVLNDVAKVLFWRSNGSFRSLRTYTKNDPKRDAKSHR